MVAFSSRQWAVMATLVGLMSEIGAFVPSPPLVSCPMRSKGFLVRMAADRRPRVVPEDGEYYRELGVPRSATGTEIRASYLKLAKKFHPDVSADPADVARFKRISAAYAVLSDEESRFVYDQV